MLFILSVFLDFVCFANDDFMQWMLLTLTLINETVFDDSIMNSYTMYILLGVVDTVTLDVYKKETYPHTFLRSCKVLLLSR